MKKMKSVLFWIGFVIKVLFTRSIHVFGKHSWMPPGGHYSHCLNEITGETEVWMTEGTTSFCFFCWTDKEVKPTHSPRLVRTHIAPPAGDLIINKGSESPLVIGPTEDWNWPDLEPRHIKKTIKENLKKKGRGIF